MLIKIVRRSYGRNYRCDGAGGFDFMLDSIMTTYAFDSALPVLIGVTVALIALLAGACVALKAVNKDLFEKVKSYIPAAFAIVCVIMFLIFSGFAIEKFCSRSYIRDFTNFYEEAIYFIGVPVFVDVATLLIAAMVIPTLKVLGVKGKALKIVTIAFCALVVAFIIATVVLSLVYVNVYGFRS